MSDFSPPITVESIITKSIKGGRGSLESVVIGPSGFVRLGQTAFNTGVGFWLGDDAGTAKFSIGNSAGNRLTWDGTNLVFTGNLSAASGTLGAITIGANAWHVDSAGNMWWGTSTTYAGATIKISAAGAINFTSGIISGAIKIGTSTDYFKAESSADGSYLDLFLGNKCCVELAASPSEPHGLRFFHPVTEVLVGAVGCGLNMEFWVGAGYNFYFTNGIIVQEAWTAPTLVNSWVNYDTATWNSAGYMKDTMGFVHLKGLIKDGGIGLRAYTLPAGYRPAKREVQATTSYTTEIVHSRVFVYSTGEVIPQQGGNTYFSLDGITFRAA